MTNGKDYGKDEILEKFSIFRVNTGGIDEWISPKAPDKVFMRLSNVSREPLSRSQLNQLLILSHEVGVSEGFYNYYWKSNPKHLYDTSPLDNQFDDQWLTSPGIVSLDHLFWGLYRLYIDSLLLFGNIRSGYRFFRDLEYEDLISFFDSQKFDAEMMKRRGSPLPITKFAKDKRHLISEVACKSYGNIPRKRSEWKKFLLDSWKEHTMRGGGVISWENLVNKNYPEKKGYDKDIQSLLFPEENILKQIVSSEEEVISIYEEWADTYLKYRDFALENTQYYLSMVDELDVYVATSMRNRDDFRKMADFCDNIFENEKIKNLNLRIFDPTLSAAEGHEDKGLIECLMVKAAKVFVFYAGDRDSLW